MAKDKSAAKEERRKEKKASKEKRSEADGVHKSTKDEKEKKVKKAAEDIEVTTKLLNALEEEKPGGVAIKEDSDLQVRIKSAPLRGALVPFANPLADEKGTKKILKSVKKGACLLLQEVVRANSLNSCQKQRTEARSQGSSQSPPQITNRRSGRPSFRNRSHCC